MKRSQAKSQVETHIFTCAEHRTFQSTHPNTLLTVISQGISSWYNGRKCVTDTLYLETKNGTPLGQKQQREKGKRWSMWWKKWTKNRVWAKKRTSGRGTSEQAPSGQRSHLQLANKQDPAVPSTFTGLLVFSGRKQKSPTPQPILETEEKENVGCLTKMGFISVYHFVLVLLRVVFLVAGLKQSNQIAFLRDASQCSHSAHTMGEFISLRQQGCQCNLWVCWSESRLRAVQLGMLMGFGWGTRLSGCSLTSAENSSSSLWLSS